MSTEQARKIEEEKEVMETRVKEMEKEVEDLRNKEKERVKERETLDEVRLFYFLFLSTGTYKETYSRLKEWKESRRRLSLGRR